MKSFHSKTSSPLLIEIGQTTIKAVESDNGIEVPVERHETGRLHDVSREKFKTELSDLIKTKTRHSGGRVYCAIGARGVSLRRMTLPDAKSEDMERLLRLQIESEFPLSPDELAWGYKKLHKGVASSGTAPVQELAVAAVKKEVVEEYAQLLSECGLQPAFVLGALARGAICPATSSRYAILDIGRTQSELIAFEHGAPVSLRTLPWGGDHLTRAIAKEFGLEQNAAEKAKLEIGPQSIPGNEQSQRVLAGVQSEVCSLAAMVKKSWAGEKLYLSGKSSRLQDLGPALKRAIGGNVECERLDLPEGPGNSAAILGMRKALDKEGDAWLLPLESQRVKPIEAKQEPVRWKWPAIAGTLLISSLALRYVEPLILKPRLARKLAEVKAYRETLPTIDRELGFLQHIDKNRSPYLETMVVIANAVSPGTRIDSLSFNRRGDISLRASMGAQQQQSVEFRNKLVNSGFFSTVVVEEQTPTPDRQKMNVRLTAQLKPAGSRPPLPESATPIKESKSEKSGTAGKSAGPPTGASPGPAAPPNVTKTTTTNVEAKK